MLARTIPARAFLVIALMVPIVMSARSASAWTKFTKDELEMKAPDWCKDADAIALDVKSEYFANPFQGLSGSHSWRVKILTEKGKEAGSTYLLCPHGYKLSDINARTITPDGRTVKVKSSQVFKTTVYTGPDRDIKRTVNRIAFPEVTAGAILECEWKTFTEQLTFVPPHYFDVPGLPTLNSELAFTLPEGVVYQTVPVNLSKYPFTEKTEHVNSFDGRQLIYRVNVSRIRTDADKPYAPADDYLRPHTYFVFARYQNAAIHVEIVPDWSKAADIVDNAFSDFQRRATSLSPILDRVREHRSESTLAESLYRWVTDSIALVDSRQCYDFDGTIDKKIASHQATGVEKALILQALYRLAGIQSQMVLTVPVGEGPLLTNLPTLAQFTGYVLRAQVHNTTVFLDPANEGSRFGMYPWSVSGRQGLLIDKESPDFVLIPPRHEENSMTWNLICSIDTAGTLDAYGTLCLTNQFALVHRMELVGDDSISLKKYLVQHFLGECSPEKILHAAVKKDSSGDTSCTVEIAWRNMNYVQRADQDLILKPNCVTRIATDFLPQDAQRAVDVYLSFPRSVRIQAKFQLPAGYTLSQAQRNLASDHRMQGLQYQSRIDSGGSPGEFTYDRTLSRSYSQFAANTYPEVRNFYLAASEKDNLELAVQRRSAK